VLIVEDELDIRDTLQEAFEEEGYQVVVAGNGKEALARLEEGPRPSAIILDIVMPIMNGAELYAALQADPALSRIPVVVSTSDPTRAPSGVLLMRKPLNLDRLIAAIARICAAAPPP
jgi:two-component system response regulator MprA